jgi:hypothetical protein
MIARHVTMHLKTNSAEDFTRTLEKEVIPLLQKQQGFKDEITFLVRDGQEAVGISFWEKQENADAYNREGYPEVLKALAKVLDGTPQVRNGEVCNSTSHRIATAVAV